MVSVVVAVGSSPLTRGKHARGVHRVDDEGLIPAHAGKTTCPPESRGATWAHPRSRGENETSSGSKRTRAGSSPLTRGKRRNGRRPRRVVGLIPAHAGKTGAYPQEAPPPAAHPRSRGENCGELIEYGDFPGSSPLTRGKLGESETVEVLFGLIPAHAGKTHWPTRELVYSGAHPRSRGENPLRTKECPAVYGSSPLTRGKLTRRGGCWNGPRLIPAHAGKTRGPCGSAAVRTAHPRSRGENGCGRRHPVSVKGSSPLTRGKHKEPYPRPVSAGLIPAHAGKTRSARSRRACPAHPRSRGENFRQGIEAPLDLGSSPLTRGKPPRSAHAPQPPRAHPRSRGENPTP